MEGTEMRSMMFDESRNDCTKTPVDDGWVFDWPQDLVNGVVVLIEGAGGGGGGAGGDGKPVSESHNQSPGGSGGGGNGVQPRLLSVPISPIPGMKIQIGRGGAGGQPGGLAHAGHPGGDGKATKILLPDGSTLFEFVGGRGGVPHGLATTPQTDSGPLNSSLYTTGGQGGKAGAYEPKQGDKSFYHSGGSPGGNAGSYGIGKGGGGGGASGLCKGGDGSNGGSGAPAKDGQYASGGGGGGAGVQDASNDGGHGGAGGTGYLRIYF